ncbi:Calnexin [Taphrina deformans PYCC 5710]|uniref:Calnexin n=1 Tax=Taphrina deformans (strain PYCC 5710 / ATCC 11124 / CBS 356.35 / IMI 108563 / JCM 9778 / NBRC 8474) TaxID=1097556 RepID=R4XC34_TAPDE|nr:Calnexin [Taphrina deformans PYCC 5710]|eukprot:CCG81941.1 Calnexin [Taphrina deformans PYCC 5710]
MRLSLLAVSALSLDEAPVVASSSSAPALPQFTPTSIQPPFVEQFANDDWQDRWTPSAATSGNEGEEEMNYVGRWAREQPHIYKGMENDFGLVLKDDARRHAISAPFSQSVDNKDKTLVLQYEVKMQKGLECGGAYLKLLTESPVGIQAQQFSGDTPYTIMFGPDKCGATNKVHFIFRHYNPISKKHEEKHLTSPPVAKISKLSTLYTLIVKPDQTFEILINNKSAKKGSLLEDFTPAVTPAKQINDPEDSKPSTWVDEAKIDDPEAVKPDDWDEDAPFEILDESAEKPAGWLEDEPALVADPDAAKPEDWDDEEDGTWVAPKVPNPKCTSGPGCGPWTPPTIKNPAYKGKYFAPKIDNPEYKGVWEPRKIDNPEYHEDLTPANFEPISGIGFELWTMQGDILFDNILISHDVSDAETLAKDWQTKFTIEEAEDNANAPKASEEAKKKYPGAPSFTTDPIGFVTEKAARFINLVQIDPVFAMKDQPEVVGAIIAFFATLFAIVTSIVSLLSSPSAGPAHPVKLKEKTGVTAKDISPEFTPEGESIASGTDMDSPATAAKSRSKKI